ncbi:MAG TPA: hypothetical protein VFL57_13920 [Bryobacteraceae bacterium]|nr:hypothetical protein [Bryobacteraceae bacterium]
MRAILLLILLAIVVGAGYYIWKVRSRGPDLTFAPYQENYASKVDLARVDAEYPIERAKLQRITLDSLADFDQEQLDQLYAHLTAGPIPDGQYRGAILLQKGSSGKYRASEIVGGLKGVGFDIAGDKLTALGEALWKGKVFYRDQRLLRNKMENLDLLTKFFPARKDDIEQLKAQQNREFFPAKLYCGQSLLDGRRESVIIDYAFTDELPGYREVPDALGGRDGLLIRDEIRMIRPGLYLGRAYMNGIFGLNFALYNDGVAKGQTDEWLRTGKVAEDCWTGPQPSPPVQQAMARAG